MGCLSGERPQPARATVMIARRVAASNIATYFMVVLLTVVDLILVGS